MFTLAEIGIKHASSRRDHGAGPAVDSAAAAGSGSGSRTKRDSARFSWRWWRNHRNKVHPADAKGHPHGAFKLTVIGLDGGGKSTIMAALQRQPLTDITQSYGCTTSEPITLDRREVMLYDLGGSSRIREIWPEYYAESHGFIFVVDAADTDRYEEARVELAKARDHPYLRDKPFLIICNKADMTAVESASVEGSVMAALGLTSDGLVQHKYRLWSTVAIKRRRWKRPHKGITLGLRWLVGAVMAYSSGMKERMDRDIAEFTAKVERERREKQERVRRIREERERTRAAQEAAEKRNKADAGIASTLPSVAAPEPVTESELPGMSA